MTISRPLFVPCLLAMALAMLAPGASAEPSQTRQARHGNAAAGAPRPCRADEEAFKVLRLTVIEDGVRVDYEFVRPGEATWTNMNRPLLKQFGVRIGATICLPRGPATADMTDFD